MVWGDIRSEAGCVLSPPLFIAYMDKITREANLNPEDLNEMLFADDQSLLHEKEEELQEHTNSLNTQCENFGMKTNISKTETMKVSRTPGRLSINIDGTTLKQVGEFTYIGSIFTEDRRLHREIETRFQRPTASATSLPHSKDTPVSLSRSKPNSSSPFLDQP